MGGPAAVESAASGGVNRMSVTINALDARNVREFFEDAGWHWADVTFGDEGYLQTAEAPTKELAGAFACCAALYGRSGSKSCVT